MKYLEKYGLYIDDDLVVYRTYTHRTINGKPVPNCYLVQVPWVTTYNGYKYYRGYANGKPCSIYLHRLIAEVFIPNPDNKPTVDHINRNRDDNRIENLKWATCIEQGNNRSNTRPNSPSRDKELKYGRRYYLEHVEEIRRKNADYQRNLMKKAAS